MVTLWGRAALFKVINMFDLLYIMNCFNIVRVRAHYFHWSLNIHARE